MSLSLFHLACLVLSLSFTQVSGDGLSIQTSETGFYNIFVNNSQWLRGTQAFFYANGNVYTTEGTFGDLGNFTLWNTEKSQNTDKIGYYTQITYNYYAGTVPIQLYIRSYLKGGVPAVIFGQKYLQETRGTKAPQHVQTIGGFPNFEFFMPYVSKVAFLSYGGAWLGDEKKHISQYDPETGIVVEDGFEGGPLAMFDPLGNTLIFSPFNQFMTASMWNNGLKYFSGNIHWGILGTVDYIPAGFEFQTIMYYGQGINTAFEGWGKLMRSYYGKTDMRSQDISLNYVGYWTDEGSYYYNGPEEGKDYEDTLLDLKSEMDELKVPYKYLELDDWLYEKDENGGTITWNATNETIPDGLTFLHQKTGLPVILQNGFWSCNTTYAEQNGGEYEFLIENDAALPQSKAFWDFLFSKASEWGLTVYQQDWMKEQSLAITEFKTNVTLGRQWLLDMGEAALKHHITIQYSGALPRHALQSLEIPAVTQARVSMDYGRSLDQWKIGMTSMFASALGLAPFKDTFITKFNDTQEHTSHAWAARESVVATLSTGPVGPGDGLRQTNPVLASGNCCNAAGLILGPSKPATAIDKQFMERAYNNSIGPKGEVWTAYSQIGKYTFGTIFSVLGKNNNVTVTPYDLFGANFPRSKLYTINVYGVLLKFDSLYLCCNDVWPFFTLLQTSPVISFSKNNAEIVLLGEMWKYVPMSSKRVNNINVTADGVYVTLKGVPGENMTFHYAVNNAWSGNTFTFDKSGTHVVFVKATAPPTTTTTTTTRRTTTTKHNSAAKNRTPLLQPMFVCVLLFAMRLYRSD